MISLVNIDKATNIVILTDDNSFCNASALYTYILRLHKKVAIINEIDFFDLRFSCVPWFDKVKKSASKSTDLVVNMKKYKHSIYKLFKEHDIILNQKIATALYADYLQRYTQFNVDSSYYEDMKTFIDSGAEFKICNFSVLGSLPLSLIRLKAQMYKRMQLMDNARVAVLYLGKKDLAMSGASFKEVEMIMQEVLTTVHVKISILLDSDNENKLIKYKEI